MGWSGFDKGSWRFLDDLHQLASHQNAPATSTLDIGGWEDEITMDPQMKDDAHPEACGFQVAKHANSKQKRRLIMKSW